MTEERTKPQPKKDDKAASPISEIRRNGENKPREKRISVGSDGVPTEAKKTQEEQPDEETAIAMDDAKRGYVEHAGSFEEFEALVEHTRQAEKRKHTIRCAPPSAAISIGSDGVPIEVKEELNPDAIREAEESGFRKINLDTLVDDIKKRRALHERLERENQVSPS